MMQLNRNFCAPGCAVTDSQDDVRHEAPHLLQAPGNGLVKHNSAA